MAVRRTTLTFYSDEPFVDLTDDVGSFVEGLNGFVIVSTKHTTTGVRVMENEPRLLRDLLRLMEDFAPQYGHYFHDDIEHRPVPDNERLNAYSHLRSLLFNSSVVIPVVGGKPDLGEWQRVMFAELDPGRTREVTFDAIGFDV